jgi:hypothetical protein
LSASSSLTVDSADKKFNLNQAIQKRLKKDILEDDLSDDSPVQSE